IQISEELPLHVESGNVAKIDPIEIAQVGDVNGSVWPGDQAAWNKGGVWVRAWNQFADEPAGVEVKFQDLAVVRRVDVLIHHQQQIADTEQAARADDLVVRSRTCRDKCPQRRPRK